MVQVATIQEEMLQIWNPKENPIAQVECIVPAWALTAHFDQWRGRDIYWFFDNTAALAAMTKANSRDVDLDQSSYIAHSALAVMQCRVWWEYVQSDSNWADGPSRDGISCEFCRRAGFRLRERAIDTSW